MRVAIFGAGICGLYLAQKLSQKNEVFLFEKRERVGEKICSALLSERIFDFFPESKKIVKNKIEGCKIYFPKKEVKIKFKKTFFAFERKELDQLAFELVERSGAKIFLKREIKIEDLKKLKEEFDRIIGADGANSILRNFLKIGNPQFYFALQGFLERKDYSSFVEVWPQDDGFLWKIPKGKKIEFGAIGKKEVKEVFDQFLDKKKIKLDEIKSAILPQGFKIPKEKNITLCGDATGITKPWSGGGIIWGLKMADILVKTFPDFLKYQQKVKKFFLFEFYLSKVLKKFVYFLGFNFPFLLPKEKEIDGDFWFH